MKLSKKLDVVKEDETSCKELNLLFFRNDDGEDGILFIAWHEFEGTMLIQTDFIKMEQDFVSSFLRDYSSVSAQDYVDSFKP